MFHWSHCRGIRTYLELRGNLVSFLLAAGAAGIKSRFNRWDRLSLVVQREVGIPFELKPGMGPHLQMRWETRGCSQVVVGNLGFLPICDGAHWAPLHWMKGVKPPVEFREGTQNCCLGAAGTTGLMWRGRGNLLVILDLWREAWDSSAKVPRGTQGASRVASGKSSLHSSCEGGRGIALESQQGTYGRGDLKVFLTCSRKFGFTQVVMGTGGSL